MSGQADHLHYRIPAEAYTVYARVADIRDPVRRAAAERMLAEADTRPDEVD